MARFAACFTAWFKVGFEARFTACFEAGFKVRFIACRPVCFLAHPALCRFPSTRTTSTSRSTAMPFSPACRAPLAAARFHRAIFAVRAVAPLPSLARPARLTQVTSVLRAD
jgi:hypothetical protein